MDRPDKALEVYEQYERYLAPNYDPLPVILVEGEGVWVRDIEGNKYIRPPAKVRK